MRLKQKGKQGASSRIEAARAAERLDITTIVFDNRNVQLDELTREVLLALWKVHILLHAAEHPVYGQWIIEELRRHGYNISPGTLYPLLRRMERLGWIELAGAAAPRGLKARREYTITEKGAAILALLRRNVGELHRELQELAETATEPRQESKPEAAPC